MRLLGPDQRLQRERARKRARLAVRAGKLVKQPCEGCGADNVEAHHDDYEDPLHVRWFCRGCHLTWHHGYRAPRQVRQRFEPTVEQTDHLRKTQTIYERDQTTAERSRERRNELVREAIREDWTHRQISEATGLSQGRISQITGPRAT